MKNAGKLTLFIGIILSATTVGIAQLPSVHASAGVEVTQDAWLEWVRARAIHLDTLNWREVDSGKLEPLDKALDGKRIVFLGEPDHYIHEKYDYRLILIRYLFDKGWRHIGMEMGFSDGMRIDRYLETGDRVHVDRVALYEYRGDMRTDRDDMPKGFPALENAEFMKYLVGEERWFLAQLRSLNESLPPGKDRLHWFGFDLDIFPGGGCADADDLLEPYQENPQVKALLRRLARRPGESRPEEMGRLEDVLADVKAQELELETTIGSGNVRTLRHIIQNLIESLQFNDLAFKDPLGRYWEEAMREREEAIIRRLDDGWLTDFPPDAKIILMAHNMHLSKDSGSIRFGKAGGHSHPMWPSIGEAVSRKAAVFSFWMLYDHGSSVNIRLRRAFTQVPSHPDRIEHLLSQVGYPFILPLNTGDRRESWLDDERNFVLNGQYGNGLIRKQADALFFVEELRAVGPR